MKVEDVLDDWVASSPYLYFKLKEAIEDSDTLSNILGM
jgi:hypothetical protein